jgi:predicted dehydrogenase
MAERKIGIGIIGLGIISAAHEIGMSEISDRAKIVAFCDIDQPRAENRAEKYGARVYTDYLRLLADPDIEIVDIILPHDLHYPVCKQALEIGKHVLMEKPLTINTSEGLELIDMARQKNLKLMVAENTRFVTAYLETQKLLQNGSLGEIYLIRTLIAGTEIYRMVDPNNWKGRKQGSGGGVIMDAAPHSFYLLKWLFGNIRELRAYANQLIPGSEVEDNAVIVGRTESGAQFNLEFSFTVQAPWTERLEVYGSKGSVVIDQIMNPPTMVFDNPEDYQPHQLPGVRYNPKQWKTESIAHGVKSFIEAVLEDKPVPVDPMDAYYTIVACERAYKSIETNQIEQIPIS